MAFSAQRAEEHAAYGIGCDTAPTGDLALHFQLEDWLGTRRVQTDIAGNVEETYASMPYGDGLTPSMPAGAPPTADDATENHFTGKEWNYESGNDYFGARYYSSAMGRFMSPDWSATEDPVPYADLDDPQSLNLYAYVSNNPLASVDADGHDEEEGDEDEEELAQLDPRCLPYPCGPPTLGMPPFLPTPLSPYPIAPVLSPGNTQTNPTTGATSTPGIRVPMAHKPKKQSTGSKKGKNDKHTKVRPGTKQPPNYVPHRKAQGAKPKPEDPYFRKDRDPIPVAPPPPPPPLREEVTFKILD